MHGVKIGNLVLTALKHVVTFAQYFLLKIILCINVSTFEPNAQVQVSTLCSLYLFELVK